jgi:Spx/MgsR family transcriptional regulator
MITLYGIRNCDTVRKARRWLAEHGVEYRFHDFRSDGISEELLAPWIGESGWEALLNRRGTTWRKLPEAERTAIDAERALQLMLEHPAIIRRPVLDTGDGLQIGFSEASYAALLQE